MPTTSAVLTIRALDVDEEQGEVDEVWFNGVYVGRLSGANDTWHSSAFVIPANLVLPGSNVVQVRVDTSGDATAWVVSVDWGQLLIDGGSGANGNTGAVRITDYSVVNNTVTINTQTSVNAVTGGNYRLEISILDPNGQTSSVLTQDFAAAAGQTAHAELRADLRAEWRLRHVYRAGAALLHQRGFPVQQDFDTAQFVHTSNAGVTDADADGLTNTQETTLGTNRFNPDTDGDGVNDATEVGNVAAPTDTDGDGIINALESTLVDTDGDGVNNQLDPANANPCVPNANSAACLAVDSDGDGLTNGQEDTIGSSRTNPDTDDDGVNGWRRGRRQSCSRRWMPTATECRTCSSPARWTRDHDGLADSATRQ